MEQQKNDVPILNRTPTTNTSLPFQRGGFASLVEALEYAARGETGYNYYSVRADLVSTLPYAELAARARTMGRILAGLGLERFSRIAIAAETNPEFITFFFACQYAGLMPVPLPLAHNLGGKDSYVGRLRGLMESAGVVAVVASEDYIDFVREASQDLPIRFVGTHTEFAALPERGELHPLEGDGPAYIQYSSGSTRRPKGVLISQRAICSNATSTLVHGLDVRPGDRAVSWLPLYHDMGLVGFCLTPLFGQVTIDYLATIDFAKRPRNWLRLISENRGTIAYGPPFAYELCQRRVANGALEGLDLSSWRVAGIGGDMVRADILDRFVETFAPCGFRRSAFLPSYGLAESTLAVAFAPAGKGFETDRVDVAHFAVSGKAQPARAEVGPENSRRFVLCGKVVPGHELEIRDENDHRLEDREIGRVVIRGPSIMDGYFNDPEATKAVLSDDGWLDTGDLGYMVDGSLVVTGRSKDLIIINGRNIWPEDIEWAIGHLPGVRTGDVAVFSVDDGKAGEAGERVVVVVQCRLRDAVRRRDLERRIHATVRAVAGIDCEVVLVPSGSIPVTSSAKISRSATRKRYLAGDYAPQGEEAAARKISVG